MASLALLNALPDFAKRGAPAFRMEAQAFAPPSEPAVDIDAIVRAAVEEAETRLAAQLRAGHELELAALRQSHAAETEAIAAQLGARAGPLIGQAFASAEARITAFASDAAARILGAALSDELHKRSVASLAAALRQAFADAEAVRIDVSGPASLCEALRRSLPERADYLHFTESSGFDLTVRVDGMLFETRLAEWSADLADILA